MTPVLILRHHDFWCTERPFIDVSRSKDWDDCLWQLHLETGGDLVSLDAGSGREGEVENEVVINPAQVSLRHRMARRFRNEMCEIVPKRLKGQDAKTSSWMKGFCAEVSQVQKYGI